MRKVATVHALTGSEQVKWRSPNATVQGFKSPALGNLIKIG
uniref:Uncharacterized protein n=1 Tax=viral metagenome TaxID=1070528 RepID=A0A6M3LR55_9ZZZZ